MLFLQLFELVYLGYQDRWFYPVLCGTLNVIVIAIFSRFKRAQQQRVMALLNVVRVVPVVTNGCVRAISSHKLVPGDVAVLQRGKATCDMALLRGTCLVVEATLSGEVQSYCWSSMHVQSVCHAVCSVPATLSVRCVGPL